MALKPFTFEDRIKLITEKIDSVLRTQGIRYIMSTDKKLTIYKGNLGHVVGEISMDLADHWWDNEIRDSLLYYLDPRCFKATNIQEHIEQHIEDKSTTEQIEVNTTETKGDKEDGEESGSNTGDKTGESGSEETPGSKPRGRGRPKTVHNGGTE